MKFMKTTVLITMLLVGFSVFEQKAEAHSNFFFGFSAYHPAYHYYYHPYRYYRPYYYRPYFYYPYYYYPYYSYYYPGAYYYRGYGEVRTEVKPSEAKVYVDGDYVGVADDYDGWWQRLTLEPGKHRIVFRAQGYVPYAVTIRTLPGQDYHIKYKMEPGQDLIDERDMRLKKDEYEDQYSRRPYRGHDSDRYRYEPREQDRDRYQDAPEQERGYGKDAAPSNVSLTLRVQPADATVYIDGNYYGTADVGGPGEIQVLLAAGTHRIEVVRPGYESYSQDVTVDASSSKRIEVTLRKKGE